LGSKTIQIGSFVVGPAVTTKIAPAEIIGQNKDDVRTIVRWYAGENRQIDRDSFTPA
jgi:hypothetical protein